MGLLKVGITNRVEERVGKQHRRKGWVLLDVSEPMDGALAPVLERAILQAVLSAGGVRPSVNLGSFDGFTESWEIESLNVAGLADLHQLLPRSDDPPQPEAR